ncbi:MAG: diguanylate cyclase [Phycisphaeraceae bacterium]|nr:diguanylate cyclase [Phycisphaeraceae bacterium]
MPPSPSTYAYNSLGQALQRVSVWVVGDESLALEVFASSFSPSIAVEREESALMALGRLGADLNPLSEGAQHEAQPRLILLQLSSAQPVDRSVLQALRQLAPQTRLVGIVETADAALPHDKPAELDAILPRPLSSQALEALLTGNISQPAVAKQPLPASPAAEEALGDVDLVAAMMKNRRSVADLALKIIRQKTGIAAIGWSADEKGLTPEQISVPVRYNGKELGWLYSARRISQSDLELWAAWLGHWLSLVKEMDSLWDLAMRDPLTGAWNRRYFDRFLQVLLQKATHERLPVTLMVFDIDDFKIYNDRYGHAAGDEILHETVRLLQSVVRTHDVVARIGGDEFAVIFWDPQGPRRPHSQHPQDVLKAADRFRQAIRAQKFPKLAQEAPGTLTISGGLASYPWDGRNAVELLERADAMALQSKRQGKNALTLGPATPGSTPGTAPGTVATPPTLTDPDKV